MPTPNITRGLVVDTPWIDLILSGQKTWEMRSTSTSHRGWFGLIRKGSGAVVGVARLDDSGAALSTVEMLATIDKHCIPERAIRDGDVAKWTTPWKLGAVTPLARPVPYRHKAGAVTWVLFDEAVSNAIEQQFTGSTGALNAAPAPAYPVKVNALGDGAQKTSPAPPTAVRKVVGGFIGETELTEANLTHNHFYMRRFINRFPPDLIGGSNKLQVAPKTAIIDWGGSSPVESDIDGQKKFFRSRGWIAQFFAANDAAPGDVVRVEETAPYRYRASLIKRGIL